METVYILTGVTKSEVFWDTHPIPRVMRVYKTREAAEKDIPAFEKDGWTNMSVNAWQVN